MVDTAGQRNLHCVCGDVTVEITGDPTLQLWCHCNDCRTWYQFSPVPIAIYPDTAISINGDEAHLAEYSVNKPEMIRSFCKACGHKFSQKHQEIPFTGVVASSIPGLKFEPQAHVYCVDAGADTLKQYKDDGLPKFVQQQPTAGGDGRKMQI